MTETAGTIVIGAGIGGLAAALRLAGAGQEVLVFEGALRPGGKLRTVPSDAGPVDAGPTVLTMRPVFESLFESVGETFSDHVPTTAESVLARHWWPDGSELDLHADRAASARAVHDFADARSAREFEAFCGRARRLFSAFSGPVMDAAKPEPAGIVTAALTNPGLLPELMPGRSLWRSLSAQFSDCRLRQLFARYATYVGGSPFLSPALLALIWSAEEAGVWRVEGGMSKLASGIAALAERKGAAFRYGSPVEEIDALDDGFVVRCAGGDKIKARSVVFNGDPSALADGMLGETVRAAVRRPGVTPRALSAWVWSFAARPSGRELAHHNVFFNADYRREFDAIAGGAMPDSATLYVCAQDRGTGLAPHGHERFEIIMNGAPVVPGQGPREEDFETCRDRTFTALSRLGLDFDPLPERPSLTTPHDFAALFPGSAGSLYGRSPHGLMASFLRPTARSRIPGLYLAGGGVHPGAGLPMALSSGRHAAEAILTDRASTSTSRRMAMLGGMSTGSRTTAGAASRS